MSTEQVKLELADRIALVTIDNPPVNSLNQEVKDGLERIFGELNANDELLVVILSGAGEKAFMAGADIKGLVGITAEKAKQRQIQMRTIMDRVSGCPCPVLCAVEGLALGAGCELAMACDIRIAGKRARFGLPESKLAAMPGAGATQRLPRLAGLGRAKKMIFTGEMITAEVAHQIGLVDHLVEEGQALNEARKMAEEISQRGPLAVRHAKQAINQSLELPLSEGLELEVQIWSKVCGSLDMQEGVAAFLEKRTPRFKGK